MKPVYSIVIPVFNEIEVLDTLYSRMTTMLEKQPTDLGNHPDR